MWEIILHWMDPQRPFCADLAPPPLHFKNLYGYLWIVIPEVARNAGLPVEGRPCLQVKASDLLCHRFMLAILPSEPKLLHALLNSFRTSPKLSGKIQVLVFFRV